MRSRRHAPEGVVERVAEWPKQWLQEGIEQGLAHERALLRRQAATRFGAETAERLSGVLAGIADPEGLAEVGEWLVRCETGSEFLAPRGGPGGRCEPTRRRRVLPRRSPRGLTEPFSLYPHEIQHVPEEPVMARSLGDATAAATAAARNEAPPTPAEPWEPGARLEASVQAHAAGLETLAQELLDGLRQRSRPPEGTGT